MKINQTYVEELIDSICNGDLVRAERLLDQGANPNAVIDKDQLAPLHFALSHRNHLAIELLLRYKADPFQCSNDGFCPINLSYSLNDKKAIQIFANYGYVSQ